MKDRICQTINNQYALCLKGALCKTLEYLLTEMLLWAHADASSLAQTQ